MNAIELIEEVIDIVDDNAFSEEDIILSLLNKSQLAIAGRLLLPDLTNGYDTVVTTNSMTVAMPANYHKGLFSAICSEKNINIHNDIKTLSFMLSTPLSSDNSGDITDIAVNGGNLINQNVPITPATVELFYYRKPTEMTQSTTSFPDGAVGNDDFYEALIHHTCSKIFAKIEDGIDGQKTNTIFHLERYSEKLSLLDEYAETIGKSYPVRPQNIYQWPGY